MDETQILENSENSCVTGTLVLKEVNNELAATVPLSNPETLTEKKTIKTDTIKAELSNHCILLLNPAKYDQNEGFMFPLSIGSNKIGRSNLNDICIIDMSLSKNHACIEIKEDSNGDLLECSLTDIGSLNKTRVNRDKVLDKNEKYMIELNDSFIFGLIPFKIVKMSAVERTKQTENRTNLLDILSKKSYSPIKKANGNGISKINNLFEIQNTLDETCLVDTENSIKEAEDDLDRFYVADTDDEIDMSASIHLEMSQSILINQSAYSNKTGTSLYIPDTMEQSYSTEDAAEDESKSKSLDKKKSMLPPAIPTKSNDSSSQDTKIVNETVDLGDNESFEKKGDKIDTNVTETVQLDQSENLEQEEISDDGKEKKESSGNKPKENTPLKKDDLKPLDQEKKKTDKIQENDCQNEASIILPAKKSSEINVENATKTNGHSDSNPNTKICTAPNTQIGTEESDSKSKNAENSNNVLDDSHDSIISENAIIPETPTQSQIPVEDEAPSSNIEHTKTSSEKTQEVEIEKKLLETKVKDIKSINGESNEYDNSKDIEKSMTSEKSEVKELEITEEVTKVSKDDIKQEKIVETSQSGGKLVSLEKAIDQESTKVNESISSEKVPAEDNEISEKSKPVEESDSEIVVNSKPMKKVATDKESIEVKETIAEENISTKKSKVNEKQSEVTNTTIVDEQVEVEELVEEPVVTEKSAEEPVVTEKSIEEPVVTEKSVEEPVITEKSVEDKSTVDEPVKDHSINKSIEKINNIKNTDNEDILVESTLLNSSKSKDLDTIKFSQPLNLDDFPISSGEEETLLASTKSRGKNNKSTLVKKNNEMVESNEKTEEAPRSTRRSTRSIAQPKELPAKSTKKDSRKKRSLETDSVKENEVEEKSENYQIIEENKVVEKLQKKPEPSKRGRRKTTTVDAEDVSIEKSEIIIEEPVEKKISDESQSEIEKVSKKPEPVKRGRRKTAIIIPEDVTVSSSEKIAEEESEEQIEKEGEETIELESEKVTKKVEPVKRGRRKAVEVLTEKNDEETGTAKAQVATKAEPAKRGRRKTATVNSEDVNEAKEAVEDKKDSEINEANKVDTIAKDDSEVVPKKTEPVRRGRRKTAAVNSDDVKAATVVVKTPVQLENLDNIEEKTEEISAKKEPAKRGRRRATIVNAEEVTSAASAKVEEDKSNAEKDKDESEIGPGKPTVGRRASLRARPSVISTPKVTTLKKSGVKTIEESPVVKTPGRAKVMRRNSVAVTTTKKSPEKLLNKKSKRKSDANNDVEENVEKEELDEKIEEKAEQVTKKNAKKIIPAKSRRKTIQVDTEDVSEAVISKNSAKSPKNVKKVDTYSYDESDKSGPEMEESKKKNLKKKRNQAEISTNNDENEKKKLKGKKKQTESESEKESPVTKKKRALKRKSGELMPPSVPVLNSETAGSTSTPKLFFHTKRVKTNTPPNGKSSGNESKTVYSPFLNTPSKSCNLTNSHLDSSTNNGTPNNKKFKLLKGLKSSSSSENLDNSSDEDNDEASEIKKRKESGNVSTVIRKSLLVNNSLNETSTANKSLTSKKNVSIRLPDEEIKTKPNGNSVLNKTTDNIDNKTTKVTTLKSARLSLGNIRAGTTTPKIMTTTILLTDKQKQIVKNLGGELVNDVRECTHLITNKIRKTYKFLACMGRSVNIISERWLEESNKSKMFLSPSTFTLNDPQAEKQYKFNLESSLLKSKSHPLFQGWTFKLKYQDSSDKELTYANLKTIIEIAGGKLNESEKLPRNSDALIKFCIVYEDKDQFIQDTKNDTAKVSKIYLDTVLNCILKQTFDDSNMIDQVAERA